MRKIMIINPKGGCGKSTLATNIASYFATQGSNVSLVDFDPQHSSLDWLAVRDQNRPSITGIDAVSGSFKAPRTTDILIMDAPAAVHGSDLTSLIRQADTVIIPVLPSPIDMRACAHFIQELLLVSKVNRNQTKLAVVANRIRENTRIYHALEAFLKSLKIPFITSLRDSQNYIRAADQGLGVFELPPSMVELDKEQWLPLVRWLKSKRSMPD